MKILYLEALHKQLGAKMGEFAGYNMPLLYNAGLIKEHIHTRTQAGLFDISHMGQFKIMGSDVEHFFNYLLPIYVDKLKVGKSRYTLLLNNQGGIIDDVILTKIGEQEYGLVVNATCLDKDYAHFLKALNKYKGITLEYLENRVLFALQGPDAESVLCDAIGNKHIQALTFMTGMPFTFQNTHAWINRSGYTGEDGFEISIDNEYAEPLFMALLKDPRVSPIGLGARNSLRLEAGLCLYGHDMNESTNPFEADLGFTISKKRLIDNEDSIGFVGKYALRAFDSTSIATLRVGIKPKGKAPIREDVLLYISEDVNPIKDNQIGHICSGGFSPTLNTPIAFAYVKTEYSKIGQVLWAHLRGKLIEVEVCELPFVPHNYNIKNK